MAQPKVTKLLSSHPLMSLKVLSLGYLRNYAHLTPHLPRLNLAFLHSKTHRGYSVMLLNTKNYPGKVSTGQQQASSSRKYSNQPLMKLDDFGIIDAYAPPTKMPSPFTRLFYWILHQRHKNFWKNCFNVGLIKWSERKALKFERGEPWNVGHFKSKAIDMYKEMNSLFAAGNLKPLHRICHDQMIYTMKSQLKSRTPGKYAWQFHGMVDRPKCVNIRAVQIAMLPDHWLQQITLRIHSRQSLAVYNDSGKLIGGGPMRIYRVLEHVVFQRCLWENEGWLIYGYYNPPIELFSSKGVDVGHTESSTLTPSTATTAYKNFSNAPKKEATIGAAKSSKFDATTAQKKTTFSSGNTPQEVTTKTKRNLRHVKPN
ncbi:hypothetical protein G9A89_003076 [Geosiphon pyriformis]|nr:hypothetical protein G9A89_003076 [Geosiphon pyriformis]